MGKGIEKTKLESKRSFGGKLSVFETKAEQNHELKHLKAYLRRKKFFRDGYRSMGNPELGNEFRMPAWFEVQETWS